MVDPSSVGPRTEYLGTHVTDRGSWDAALEEYGGTAMQSWRWGEFLQRLGYTVLRVRTDGPHGTGLAQIVIENLGHETAAHIPRGPVIAGEWLPVAGELFAAVDEIAAQHGATSVVVEPDALLPPDAAFAALGFVAADQPHYSPARTVKIPLLDDDALLLQMRSGTRKDVRRGPRRGIQITRHSSSDAAAMTAFHELLRDTARRNEFEVEERSYYESFMSLFGDDAVLLLAHLGEIPVAGVMVFCALREGVAMFAGSSTEHRIAGATAYLQFEAMRWLRDRGCARYDLWAIPAEDPTPMDGQWQRSRGGDWQGIHHFKVGFGGDIVCYPPAWRRPIQLAALETRRTVNEDVTLTIVKATDNDSEPRAALSGTRVTDRGSWDAALEEYGGTAMQSWRWGEFLQQLGYTVERIRIDGPHGTGLAQIIFENLGHRTVGHIPRGPVIAGEWLPVAGELFAAVDEYARLHGATSVVVEPDAPLPPDAAYAMLEFIAADQPHYSPARTVKIPLLDDDALLKQMYAGTRYKVGLGRRRGVRITQHASSDATAMATFYELLQDTARRTEFEISDRSYYEAFMSVFGGDAVLLLAHVDGIAAAAAIVFRALREGVYIYGASSTEHRVIGATAYLQFEAMRWARDQGCVRYDLWGIGAEDPTPKDGQVPQSRSGEWQGLHHFKVGFGGDVVSYPPAWQRSVRPAAPAPLTTVDERVPLTIGMPTYNDFNGVYFTLQALRLYEDLENTELLVVDNYGCEHTRAFVEGINGRYVLATDAVGTAAAKNRVFAEARGEAVLCCDSHVLFPPGTIAKLRAYYRDHPDCRDLLQGPIVYDDLQTLSTNFDPVWRGQMWGIWATDPRGTDPNGAPFEIWGTGMGVFSCRKSAWPGFNPAFRGFGGEEGYIHEKFRQAGARCLCLPWLRWNHRFGRPAGIPYSLTVRDKCRNYIIGFTELGLDLEPVRSHFAEWISEEEFAALEAEALAQGMSPLSQSAHPHGVVEFTPAV